MIEPTAHSNEGVIGRLGLTPLETVAWLRLVKPITYKEATAIASVFNHTKHNTYYTAPDPKRPHENVVIIVRGRNIVTIMTKLTNSFYGVEAEMREGKRMIRTLDGGMIHDGSNWTRKLHERSQGGGKNRKAKKG